MGFITIKPPPPPFGIILLELFPSILHANASVNDGHFRLPKRLPAKPKHNGAPKVRAAGAICLSYAAMVKGLQTRWDFFGGD